MINKLKMFVFIPSAYAYCFCKKEPVCEITVSKRDKTTYGGLLVEALTLATSWHCSGAHLSLATLVLTSTQEEYQNLTVVV